MVMCRSVKNVGSYRSATSRFAFVNLYCVVVLFVLLFDVFVCVDDCDCDFVGVCGVIVCVVV